MKCAVYRHYSANGELLYVGRSINPLARSEQHLNASSWFRDVAKIEIEWCDNIASAARDEKCAIRDSRPLKNILHTAEPKSVFIKVRVTPEEKEAFSEAARLAGTTVSDILRQEMALLVQQHKDADQ